MTTRLPRQVLIPLIIACALFMENLDSTVIATALPNIAHSFGTDPLHLSLAITSYLLSLAVFIPASGWIADRFGAKNVLVVGLLMQAFGVLSYVFVNQLTGFYTVAVIVGFIYAGVMPLYAVIARENFPLKMMGTVIGGTAMAGSLGMATGPCWAACSTTASPPTAGFMSDPGAWASAPS